MRRPFRFLVPFAALSLGLSACSLLVDFDEEGQPCDDRNQCMPRYVCKAEKCVADGTAGGPDSGSDAGSDAGSDGGSDAGRDAGSDAGPVDGG